MNPFDELGPLEFDDRHIPDPIPSDYAGAVLAVAVLNRIHTADARVLPALIGYRVPCNDVLADDPTVQVGLIDNDRAKGCEVGLLGILNGIFGANENSWGYIAAVYDDDHKTLLRFEAREHMGASASAK